MINIVLLGVGHTHLHVLNRWKQNPIPGARLICISNQEDAAYSGMLPGVLAGNYAREEMKIDLRERCNEVGADLVLAETNAFDLKHRELHFDNHSSLRFDLLSIGIGSRPASIPGDASACSIKPMQTFLQRMSEHIDRVCSARQVTESNPLRVTIIGGGAGGVEVALCLPQWLERKLGSEHFRISIVHRGRQLLPGAADRTIRLASNIFARRGVQLCLEQEAVTIDQNGIEVRRNARQQSSDGTDFLEADLVITAVGAVAPSLLAKLDVAKDERGFVLTHPSLESVDCRRLFVVGDSGTLENRRVAKAGVYAVRQGPVLWDNLMRASQGERLNQFRPQSDFLWLLNTGDRRAILQYKGIAIHATWCWWLKNWIDQRFIRKHQN